MSEIQANFGQGSIMRLGATPTVKIETFSSGALTLDLALGGGIPRGRIIEARRCVQYTSSQLALLTRRARRSTARRAAARRRLRCTRWLPCKRRAALLR